MSTLISKTIGRNVLSGYAVFFTRTAVAFFLTPLIIQRIGISDYGLWLLVLSVTGYFSLFDFGFGQAVVRYVAMKKATGERHALNELVSTFLFVYGAIGLLIGIVTVILSFVFPLLFHVAAEQENVSRFALLVTGFATALNFPLAIFGGLLHGHQRYDVTRTIGLATTAANSLLTVLLLVWGFGLPALVLLASATSVTSSLAQLAFVWRVDPGLEVRAAYFRLGKVREVTTYSAYFFIVSAAVQICHQSDQIVIGLLLPTAAVAIYGVNLRLVELARSLSGQLNQVLFPVLAGLHAISDRAELQKVLVEGTKISVAIIIAIVIQLVILGPSFLSKWVGPQFVEGYPAMIILAIVAVMAIGQDIAAKTLMVGNGQKLVAGISVLDATTNVVLSVLLVQRLGITGAALGTAIPFSLVAATNVTIACRRLGLPMRRLAAESLAPAALSALPAALLLWGLSRWSPAVTWWDIIWQGSFGLAVNSLGFILLCLPVALRSALLDVIQRKIGRPGLAKG